jgi:hypothetical protein
MPDYDFYSFEYASYSFRPTDGTIQTMVYILSSTVYALLNSQQGGLSSIVKSSPVIGLEWPRGFQKLRFPDFMITAQDGGKVVSLTHRPPLTPGNAPGTHFC